MEGCTRVRRCLICHRSRLKNSSVDSEKLVSNASLLQDFLICFHINVLDSEVHDLSTSCQFCQSCEQFIAEWSSIQTQMTQLTRRAAQLEATLSALLLSAPRNRQQNHDNGFTEIIESRIQNSQEVELPLFLQQTIDDIRNELRKKYLVNVMVNRIQLPCPPAYLNPEELGPLSGNSDNDDEPMDDSRGDDESDAEYLPNQDQMDDEDISDQIVVMRINTEEEDLYDDSDGPSEYSVDLTEINVNRKSKIQSKVRKKSQANVKRKRQTHPAPKKQRKRPENAVVIPDGPSTFKYNGHGLKLNDEDQCYYCSACDFKGSTKQSSILIHIRATHYTEDDKLKFTAVKTSDTEWLYGGVYKIISVGEKFRCVTCGYVSSNVSWMVQHVRSQHADMEGSKEVAHLPVTDTPTVPDSTPIQGVYQSVPYTFNPVNNKYTCGICQAEIYLRKNFGQHTIKYHRAGPRKKHNPVVIPDGLNTFKYHGHPLKLNVTNQCYYCGTCDYQGNTHLSSILGHIRHRHYTEEDKRKFTAVKISEGEWLYRGEHKIIKSSGKFQCVSCGVMNTQVYGLIEHIRKEHADLEGPDERVVVPVSETPSVIDSTPIQGQLQSVPYTFDPIDREYTCGICQSQVGPRNRFLSHIKELHPDNRPKHQHFAVPDGPNTFNYNGHGLKLNDEDKCYYCGACGFKGKTFINSVLRHIREMHYTQEDKVKFTAVPITDTEWLYGGSFKIIRVGEMFKCVSCGCVKSRLSELSGHIRSEHFDMDGNPQKVPLPATAPPTVSDSTPIEGVYRSVPYTFNPADNKYNCGVCHSQVSSIQKQIRRHIRECHLDAAPVICEICGKELSNQRGYRSHVRRHKAEPQSCPTCDKTIYCPRRFRLHLKVHAFGDAAKKYQCEFCGKKFMCRSHYTNHVPVHTGEMRFVCEACGRKFRYAAELSAHRKSEHGIAQKTRKMLRINE